MTNTESRKDRTIRYAGNLAANTVGGDGLAEGILASWNHTKGLKKEDWRLSAKVGFFGERVIRAFGRGVGIGAVNFIAPAMYKNITYTKSFGWKVAKSFVALPLDAANNAITVASVPFTGGGAVGLKLLLNGVENAIVDGVGYMAEKINTATVGKLRRGGK